jgi:Tol biopolymer transport system component
MPKQKSDNNQDYTNPELLQKALHQLLDQTSNRDQKISWLNAERAATVRSLEQTIQTMSVTIAEKDALLLYRQTQITDRDSQLQEILTSRTWKMALLIQRIRVFLLPPQSRRARIVQDGLKTIISPLKKFNKD